MCKKNMPQAQATVQTSVTPYPSHICVAPNHNLTTKWCVRPILNFVKIRYFKGFGVLNDWT